MYRRLLALSAVTVSAVLALAGCAGSGSQQSAPGSGPIAVVASTNVWGDIAATVGGDAVSVTSVIDSPSKDPHEYEADAQNQLAISKAAVVVENGGGYDDFVDTMVKASGNSSAVVINAVDVAAKAPEAGGALNEHVWYDFAKVALVVDALRGAFTEIDPAHASDFQKNADDLTAKLTGLEKSEADLRARYAGTGVAITEPVPVYMLNAIGLVNKTPPAFSEAIEQDTDVPAAVLQETTALFSSHAVKLLAYNEQTTGPQTEAVLTAARDADVAVVPVTETLPDGATYLSWMTDNLDALSAALAR